MVVIAKRGLNPAINTLFTAVANNLAIINQFISKVSELSAITPGVILCSPDVDASSTLSFFSSGATHPYAVVNTDSGSCGIVKMSPHAVDDPLLGTALDSRGQASPRSYHESRNLELDGDVRHGDFRDPATYLNVFVAELLLHSSFASTLHKE